MATKKRFRCFRTKEAFLTRVSKTRSCWLWLGTLTGRDKRAYYGRTWAAHVAYELWIGSRNGLQVLHTCDNPQCVNPKHLFLGTISDNMKDAYRKGRKSNHGVKNPRARLTVAQVKEIRRRYRPGNGHLLAAEFGLDRTQPFRIAKRITWRSVK